MKKTTFFTSVMLLFCFQMQALEFEVDNLMYSTNGSNTVTLKGGRSLNKELNIPSVVSHNGIDYSVTALADSLFFRDYSFQSKRLTIPSSIITIGAYAFSYCESLKGILAIPSSVTMIGEGAFSSCRGLTDYIVDPNNSNYSSVNGVLFSKDQTVLHSCLAGKSGQISIYPWVTVIGKRAFFGCEKLTGTLAIPSSVISIGVEAFSLCRGLTDCVVRPDNPNYSASNGILYNKDQTVLLTCLSGKRGKFSISPSVTTIGQYAFYYCRGLTGSLVIPPSVTTIGENAFSFCRGLSGSLVIPPSVTTIGSSAFSSCSGFKGSLVISMSVTQIGAYAFFPCNGLTDYVVDPNNPHYSSVDGILYNKSQTHLYSCLPGKKGTISILPRVTVIGEAAFLNCHGLIGPLTIPPSVTTIGNSAFRNCSGFTDLIIPSSLITVGDYSFASNWKTVVNYQRIPMTIDKSVFDGQRFENCVLKVPTDSKHSYQTANVWKDFGTIEEF